MQVSSHPHNQPKGWKKGVKEEGRGRTHTCIHIYLQGSTDSTQNLTVVLIKAVILTWITVSTISRENRITFGSIINFIASTNFVSVNSSTGMGAGPTPLACTRSPQKGWSPKKGTMVVGHYIAKAWITISQSQLRGTQSIIDKVRYDYRSSKTSSRSSSTSVMHLKALRKNDKNMPAKY